MTYSNPKPSFSEAYLAHLSAKNKKEEEEEVVSTELAVITPDALVFPNRRTRLWIEAGKACHYCHQPTKIMADILPWQATVDHVIPRGRGGDDTVDNCVSACAACNRRRNMEDINGLTEGSLLANMPELEGGRRGWVTGTEIKGQQLKINHHVPEKQMVVKTVAYKPHPSLNESVVLRNARDHALVQLIAVRKNEASLIVELAEAQAALKAITIRSLVVSRIRRDIERVLARLEGKR